MREYFEFVSRTWVLSATLATVLILVLSVFPALPIGGEMLDVKAGYTYPEVIAAMESYGEQGGGCMHGLAGFWTHCCRSSMSACWQDSSTGSDQRNGFGS